MFNPIGCIPGTRHKSSFRHKLCIRMNKDRKRAQKNENSLICRAFSIMGDFFPFLYLEVCWCCYSFVPAIKIKYMLMLTKMRRAFGRM